MKRASLMIVFSCFLMNSMNAQQSVMKTNRELGQDLMRLAELKCHYEKYLVMKEVRKKDSTLSLYSEQIKNIQNNPQRFLQFIKIELNRNKQNLAQQKLPYRYISGTQSVFDIDSYVIKKIDFYRVIKYSLFERKDKLLPENFRGLPVVNTHNYKEYRQQLYEELMETNSTWTLFGRVYQIQIDSELNKKTKVRTYYRNYLLNGKLQFRVMFACVINGKPVAKGRDSLLNDRLLNKEYYQREVFKKDSIYRIFNFKNAKFQHTTQSVFLNGKKILTNEILSLKRILVKWLSRVSIH